MSTVAFSKGVMAADRRVSIMRTLGDDKVVTHLNDTTQKIYRIGGSLYGIVGMLKTGFEFLDWVEQNKPNFKRRYFWGDFTVLEWDGSKLTQWRAKTEVTTKWFKRRIDLVSYHFDIIGTEANFCALGSGKQYAIGAMEAGQSATESIRIAARHDPMTGNGVDYMTLPDSVSHSINLTC